LGFDRDGIADLDETIGLIYEAALDPALWPGVLRRITDHGRATCTVMLALEPRTARPVQLLFDVWPGYDQFVAHYAEIDPRNAYARGQPAGSKFTDYSFTTEAEITRSEFYQDYLLPHGVGYVGAIMLTNDARSFAGIAIQRSRQQGPFELAELDLLERLAPHLTRALRLQTRFAALEAERWADQILRDRLPFAVILVDERGRIVSQNQAATDLFAGADGLTARCGRLWAAHPTDQAALDRLIRGAAVTANGQGVDGGGAVALRRPSLRRPLGVLVMPIPRRGSAFTLDIGAPSPAALIIVTDPEAMPQTPVAILQRLYGLTPAEAGLARALAAGRSLHEYADAARVTSETARWRLKQVLAKTDTHRQAELVRLLLTSAVLG
jgi:DNA-binding CsgD family transcriptional regulator/PAS domain-containing protein